MSSVRVDISPAVPTRKRDITSWVEPDIMSLGPRGKKRYHKRKNAVEDYFTTNLSLHEITLRHHFSEEILLKLAERCLMEHEDGTMWGYRALVPGANVIDHTPESISEVNASKPEQLEDPTTSISEEVIDQESCKSDRSSLDSTNELPIEDDEDTAKRQAVKKPSAAAPLVTIAPTSLNGDIKHQLEANKEKSPALLNGHKKGNEVEVAEPAANELKTRAAENEQVAEIEEGVKLEKPGTQQETSNTDHDETVKDSSELPALEPRETAFEEESIESNDHTIETVETIELNEEKLDASYDDITLEETTDDSIVDSARTQLVVRENLLPAILPLYGNGRKRVDVKKVAHKRRSMHKQWIREVQSRRKQRRFRSIVATVMLASLMFVIFIPLGTGLAAYSTYSSIKNVALDGVDHLLTVKSLLPISKSDPTAALNAPKLEQAQTEFNKAESDFLQLQQLVNRSDVQSAVQQVAPQYNSQLDMAQRLVQVGIDVSRMGKEVVGVALLGANIIHSSPLASTTAKPLISVTDISNAYGVMIHAQYYINDIQMLMSQVSLKDLPISSAQKKQLTTVMALLPKVQDYITQGQSLIGIVSWLLGVDHARHFLVQTMDRGELRPGGGFTGMYGLLSIQNGRMAPFTLQDVTPLDYAGNGTELGRQAPPEYRSWMKFGNWGLRDVNLSGDFPTTARLAMQVFQEEGGGPVDGNIALTPTVIAHILNVIGPVYVKQYNETITAQNLEEKLHYYQQDFGAIAVERQKTGTSNAATRKAFTSLLGHMLLDKVRHLKVTQLVKVMQNAVKDIQSRDLEIYFTDPLAENWLIQHGYSGGTDTFAKHDGFMVVQANISISKASQYVHTTEQDQISIDAQGGANHNLTITLNYQQTGPVYGFDTYADYIRVYAPANAQLQSGSGFDSGRALCVYTPPSRSKNGQNPTSISTSDAPLVDPCAHYSTASSSSDSRYCPNGNYSLGARGGLGGNWPVDKLGGPTQLTSDLPGRTMWGGLTLTPKNCISTITIQWYVPNAVKYIPGQSPYSILVQKQGGYIPTVQITIDTSAVNGLKPLSFQGDILADKLFSLAPLKKN